MNITLTARHFKASPALQQYAEDAITGLTQLYEGIVSADVILEESQHGGNGHMAEVSLLVYKEKLFAKEHSDDMVKSIQGCVDKIERQLIRYKEKLHDDQRPHERPEITNL